jgi:uncharacterized protein (DUF58 family)
MANKLLEPRAVALVSRLELVARRAVDGFLSGRHPSPYHGSSVEYADHRPYTMGDEIRTIDWKLLAKTDKTYVKLFEDQTNLRATVLVDSSASMGFSSDPGNLPSKFEYGCRIAACLAYLLIRQKDAVGLALFDDKIRTYLPARSTPSHFRLMIEQMEKCEPAQTTASGKVMMEIASRVPRRGMVVVVSDLIDDLDGIVQGLSRFTFDKHDVLVFHTLDPAELQFPYEGLTRFKCPETAQQIISNPRHARKRYMEELAGFLDTCRRKCRERDISYELCSTDSPYEKILSRFLEERRMASR